MRFVIQLLFAISLFLTTSNAHFELKSPPGRVGDEKKQGEFPCGGSNVQSGDRARFPLSGGPIQMDMGHDRSLVQVNLALGSVAVDGSAFNVNIVPVIQEEGLGDFCIGHVVVPSNLNVRDGDNATLQVITNGEATPGLYNCADITFSASTQPGDCRNGTNVRAEAYTGPNKNANGSDAGTATTSNSASSSTPTGGAVAPAPRMTLGLLGSFFSASLILSVV